MPMERHQRKGQTRRKAGTQSHGTHEVSRAAERKASHVHTLDRAAVVLRRIIAACLVAMAVVALLLGYHAGESSMARTPTHPRVLDVSLATLPDAGTAVRLRLSAPLSSPEAVSVSLAGGERRWACARPAAGQVLLTCPVTVSAAAGAGPLQVEVHI
jgi:hypothetical protein